MHERAPLPPGPAAWRDIAARRRDLQQAMIGVEVATDRLDSRDKVLVFNAALRSALDAMKADERRQARDRVR